VAVIDSAGEARALLTADGSDGSHVFVAMRKALTALTFETPSSHVADIVSKDKSMLARVTPNMFVMGGAVPIVAGHTTIGAIGVSGAAGVPFGHQDEACAQAGLRKIQHNLAAPAMTMLNMRVTLQEVAPGQHSKVGDVDQVRLVYDANDIDPKTKRVKLINMQHFINGKWSPAPVDPVFMPTDDAWLDTGSLPYRLHFKASVVHGEPIIIDANETTLTLAIHPQQDRAANLQSGHYDIDPTPITGPEAVAAGSKSTAAH
jgi:uncharacterized protein GlcG (DUF336 family)